MALFGIYRIVAVESNGPSGKLTLHIENPSTGRTFCGVSFPWKFSKKLFVPAWECKRCYERAERKARPMPLKIKHPKAEK